MENDTQQVNEVVQPSVSSVLAVAPKSKKPFVFIAVAVLLIILLGGTGVYIVAKLRMSKSLTELRRPSDSISKEPVIEESTDSSQTPAVDSVSIDASIDSIQGDLNTLDSDLNAETELNLDSSILDINK